MSLRVAYAFLFALLALVLSSTPASAQESTNTGDRGVAAPTADPVITLLHNRSSQFLAGLSGGGAQAALDELLEGSGIAKQQAQLQALVENTRALEKFGKYRGQDRVETRRLGEDVVVMRYLYKTDETPIVWTFHYYRDFRRNETSVDANNWVIVGVNFSTDLASLRP